MSFFAVTKQKIKEIVPIEGADFIQKSSLEGLDFQFVVPKGKYSVGDEVLYFPLDAIIPDNILIELGLLGKLSRKGKNVVKTKAFKGMMSQGLIGPLSLLKDRVNDNLTPEEITSILGVIKYEPEEKIISKGVRAFSLPSYYGGKYDIESAQGNKEAVAYLLDKKVVITEKVEGQNLSVSFDCTLNKIRVCSRSLDIAIDNDEGKNNPFWLNTFREELDKFVIHLSTMFPNKNIILFGEQVGPSISGNIYNLTKFGVKLFDLKIGGVFIDYDDFINFLNNFYKSEERVKNISVPVLAKDITLEEFLNGKTIVEAAHGQSLLYPTLREGIVIKPKNEQYLSGLGRLILKVRDPIYLGKTEN